MILSGNPKPACDIHKKFEPEIFVISYPFLYIRFYFLVENDAPIAHILGTRCAHSQHKKQDKNNRRLWFDLLWEIVRRVLSFSQNEEGRIHFIFSTVFQYDRIQSKTKIIRNICYFFFLSEYNKMVINFNHFFNIRVSFSLYTFRKIMKMKQSH